MNMFYSIIQISFIIITIWAILVGLSLFIPTTRKFHQILFHRSACKSSSMWAIMCLHPAIAWKFAHTDSLYWWIYKHSHCIKNNHFFQACHNAYWSYNSSKLRRLIKREYQYIPFLD